MRMQRSAGENSGRGKRTAGSGGKLRADSKGGKYIFNPMIHRQRLSRFLSSILNRQVRVRQILPNEGGRIVAGSPFVIMDIVVELEDRSQMRSVYTIVIMEESVEEFHRHPEAYIHRGRQQFDTGLKMPLLQEYVFIPLDVYRKKLHNKAIETELEAWLGFLAFDDLERIWEISRYDPVFGEMYHELSEFRRKPKEVLGMFSGSSLKVGDRH